MLVTWKQRLLNDYKDMVDSVNIYKGFYVGRYETSLDASGNAQSVKGVKPAGAANSTGNANTWYGLYAKQRAYTKESVQGSMIWGSQYDAMLNWALRSGNDSSKVTSTGNALHSGLSSVYETGKQTVDGKYYRINNVYDLEGNGLEWTLEAEDAGSRVLRGGFCIDSGSPSYRFPNFPYLAYSSYCSRLTLYVK